MILMMNKRRVLLGAILLLRYVALKGTYLAGKDSEQVLMYLPLGQK